MKAFHSFFLILTGLALFLGFTASVRAELPIGLVAGDGYGRSEVKSIQDLINRDLSHVVYEDCGDYLAPGDFSKYRLVVMAGGHSERSYTAEESAQIEDYVRKGGRLLLINQSPKMFSVVDGAADKDSSYLFGRSYYMRDNPLSSVFQPEAPLLAGAFEQNAAPFWLTGNVMLKGVDWNQLIGMDDYILVGSRDLDKGRAYYLGSELFRLQSRAKKDGDASAAEGWERILKNILTSE